MSQSPTADGPDEPSPDEPIPDEPTPGERLLYVLGQLYRRWRTGTGRTSPHEVDVEALARMLGLWSEIEFVQDSEGGGERYIHFPTDVLVIDDQQDFPWRLLSIWEWGRQQELKEFWDYFH